MVTIGYTSRPGTPLNDAELSLLIVGSSALPER